MKRHGERPGGAILGKEPAPWTESGMDFSPETRERAARMIGKHRADHDSEREAMAPMRLHGCGGP